MRLGDTDLLIEVEKDRCQYGEECKFGGGKVLRDGIGQAGALNLLITNALVLGYPGT